MRLFDYMAPQSLDEAAQILSRTVGAVRAIAGGTDLVDQVRQGRREPSIVMDVKRIPELTKLDWEPGVGLHIGAATSCASVYEDSEVRERYPAIVESSMLIGAIQIQNRAALGGNVCNAAPSGDTIPSLLIYETKAIILGPNGLREVPLNGFFVGPGKTILADDEILVELLVPPPPPQSHSNYLRFIPRDEMDIAVVGVGSLVALSSSGTCSAVRIALASVGPTPVRAAEAEGVMVDRIPSTALLADTSERAVLAAHPINDVRGTAEFRRELVKVLTRRTLTHCLQSLGVPL